MVSRVIVPPALGKVRLATPEDATAIFGLVNESMALNFRIVQTPTIINLIETSVLSIIQLDINDTIVGFVAAKDHPLIPSVLPGAWEEYIWTRYKTVEMTARNTLFIHLLCWHPIYSREVVDNLLRTMFMHDAYLYHIAMVKSLVNYHLLMPGHSRCEGSFRRVTVMERGVPGEMLPILFIADRSEVCPRLRIRRAVEEDNDDLLPIIERHSERLRQLYGDFYISELVSRHPESDRVLLVCEHKELAVGLMILNTEINFQALEENFDLSPFSGLRHLVAEPFGKRDIDASTCNLLENAANSSTLNFQQRFESELGFDTGTSKKSKAVAWVNDSCDGILSASGSQAPFAHRDVIELLDNDDDDEMDFDIVNIDTDLLRVPQLLSYDSYGNGTESYISRMLEGKQNDSPEDKSFIPMFKKPSVSSIGGMFTAPEPIHYFGPSNAFLLEVFAMHPDYDERFGFDILEVAYEMFPGKDYCILCLPSNHVAFPLLEHFTVVAPYSCRKLYISDSLYVAHANSVRGIVSTRPAEAFDLDAVMDVLENAPRQQFLMDLFQKSLRSSMLASYVLLSQNQPVGVVVLGALDDAVTVRTQYELEPEPRLPGTDGAILAGVLSPVLEAHARWYVRDLLRQTKYTTLFWLSKLMARGDANPARNLMSLAGCMSPVRPRRSMPNITGNKDLGRIFKDASSPFALWRIERPLTSLPKVDVNNGIVVVGASRTGLAFLETLIMGPTSRYLTFTNVALISEHGLPTVTECLRAADTCVPRDGRYTDRYLKSMPFYFYVDVLAGIMTSIDRKKKCVHLKGGGVKYYDHLILTCGHQFQHPEYLSESLELAKHLENNKPCERMLMDDPHFRPDRVPPRPEKPENVMIINSLFEANIYLRKLLRMISESNSDENRRLSAYNPVFVYGDCIEAYSCIAALLELGLAPETIKFVEPFPSENHSQLRVNCFNNEVIDERAQKSLADLGIYVYRRCRFSGWRVKNGRVVSLKFMSRLHAFQIPCFAMFYYGLKAIDLDAFKAINQCGLVYDGGLVVGPAFDTNDPHVFGAGTFVRYSRRLYADRREHRYFYSEDVGEALAKLFLRKLNPFVMGDPELDPCPSDILPRYNSNLLNFAHPSIPALNKMALGKLRRWQPVKKFESPIVQLATLPGPLYYLKIRKPGPELPMEVELTMPHQGHTLITNKAGNYFRLKLNVLHCVDAVTCLSKNRFSSELLAQLYGKHEVFFNKLLARYMMHKIDDLYEFFKQPWMSALYLETFDDMLADISQQDVGTVYDIVRSHFSLFDDRADDDEGTSSSDTMEESLGEEQSSREDSQCSNVPSCGFGPGDARTLGTFRSVIDKYIGSSSFTDVMQKIAKTDIPSECGQSEATRMEARGFWNAVGGERIVNAHLARYLDRNHICNPQYAKPKPELI